MAKTENALWTLIAPNGDAEALTWGAPCSATGKAPATHLSTSTAADETMMWVLKELLDAGILGKLDYEVFPYTAYPDWRKWLEGHGLTTIPQEAKL